MLKKTSRSVWCPRCQAKPGEPCVAVKRNAHAERTRRAYVEQRKEEDRLARARAKALNVKLTFATMDDARWTLAMLDGWLADHRNVMNRDEVARLDRILRSLRPQVK